MQEDIILAILWNESRHQEDVQPNPETGAVGMAQIHPINWRWLQDDHDLDVEDTEDNIHACVLMISNLLADYDEDYEVAIAAYAVGESAMLEGQGFEHAQKIIEWSQTKPWEGNRNNV